MTLEHEIRVQAQSLGFHRVGITAAGDIGRDFERYQSFVQDGMHGEMAWLANNGEVRRSLNGAGILEGARSVVVCALAYHRDESAEPSGPTGATIAKYARGRDYHRFFRQRLRKLATWMRTRVPGSNARPMVDTAPVLERAWAQRAGVGFVGKNGCIIVPGLGSLVLLGEVVSTIDLAIDDPIESRCGSCTRCLDACPTNAFVRPFVLDARRCVSYLTIELRTAMPVELRRGVGDRLFGCDVCQDVCPFNRTSPPALESTADFAMDSRWSDRDIIDFAQLDEPTFMQLTEGSPLRRAGRAGLVRNAITVMGNSKDTRYLPTLEHVAESDADDMVREAARWAVKQITGS